MKPKPLARPYDYLRLHGWKPLRIGVDDAYVDPDDTSTDGWWLHPYDKEPRPGPPALTYTTKQAVEIQLLNDRVALLLREGWEVERSDVAMHIYGDVHGQPYLTDVRTMRSSPSMKRSLVGVPLALERQRMKGWTARFGPPEPIKAIWDSHQGVVAAWCVYCERWHVGLARASWAPEPPPAALPHVTNIMSPRRCMSPIHFGQVVIVRVVPDPNDDLD